MKKTFAYFRWNENSGSWDFRTVSSGDAAMNRPRVKTLPVTIAEVPFYTKYGTVTLSTEKEGIRTEQKTWGISEFEAGNIVIDVDVTGSETTYITFRSTEAEDDDTWEETIEYKYVGIDPVLNSHIVYFERYPPLKVVPADEAILMPVSMKRPVFLLPTNAEKEDVITIDGETVDGNAVHYELTQEWNLDTITVPEGEYTITNQTSGIKEEVTIDTDKAEDGNIVKGAQTRAFTYRKPMNLRTPVSANHYSLSAPNGDIIGEGTLSGKAIEDFTDIDMSSIESLRCICCV